MKLAVKYLLDSNAVIALLNKNPAFVQRIRRHRPGDFALSSIVLFELVFGAHKSVRQAENLEKLDRLPFAVLPFTPEDARRAGEIRAALSRQGAPIGAYDVLIAGQAAARGLTLLTHNVKEFARVPGLHWEDWLAD